MPNYINPELARERFDYCKETGQLFRKNDAKGKGERREVGTTHVSGPKQSKKHYVRTWLDGDFVYVHRIIWVLMTGDQPIEVDHIDGNGMNNKWENLRNTCHRVNGKNQKIHASNTSGVTGVCFRKESGKWRARIIVDGSMKSLGTFKHKSDAVKARKDAEQKYGFGITKEAA